jgi:hypothetical protein
MVRNLVKIVLNDFFNVLIGMIGVRPSMFVNQTGVLFLGAWFPLVTPNHIELRTGLFQSQSETANSCKKLNNPDAHCIKDRLPSGWIKMNQ